MVRIISAGTSGKEICKHFWSRENRLTERLGPHLDSVQSHKTKAQWFMNFFKDNLVFGSSKLSRKTQVIYTGLADNCVANERRLLDGTFLYMQTQTLCTIRIESSTLTELTWFQAVRAFDLNFEQLKHRMISVASFDTLYRPHIACFLFYIEACCVWSNMRHQLDEQQQLWTCKYPIFFWF